MKYTSTLLLLGLATVASSAVAAAPDLSKLPPPAKQEGVTYDKDIRPLFEASCFRCHGEQKPKAGLRLDSLQGVLKGSKDGKVVLPGKSEKSQLVIAVARIDDESAMPPKPKARRPRPATGEPGNAPPNAGGEGKTQAHGDSGTNQPPGGPRGPMPPPAKPLTPEQVGLVRAWIDQGAR